MSRILAVEMENFKGNTCKQQFTGKDIFIGANGAGKSSRIQSLIYGILGYVPEQGKNITSTYQFASKKNLSVKVSSDKFEFERSIVKKISKGEEKLEEKISISPSLKEKTLAEKKKRILSEIGNFPMMLDFQQFIDKTDSQKREFIYSLTANNSSLWDKARIEKYLRKKLLTKNILANEEMNSTALEMINSVMEQFPNDQKDTDICIQNLIDWASKRKFYWKEELKNTEGLINKSSEFKNEDTTFGNLNNIGSTLDKMNLKLIDLEKKYAVAKNNVSSFNSKKDNIQKLKNELEVLKSTQISNPEKVNLEIQNLSNKISNIDYSNKIKDISKKISEAKTLLEKKRDRFNDVIKLGTKEKTEIETIQKITSQIKTHKNTCVLSKKIGCNNDFSEYLKLSQAEYQRKYTKKDQLGQEYLKLNQEITQLKKVLNLLEKDKDNLTVKERACFNQNAIIEKKINGLKERLYKINNEKEVLSQKIKLKDEELNRSSIEFENMHEPSDQQNLDILCKNINQVKMKIIQLKEYKKSQDKTKSNLQNLKRAQIQNGKAQKCTDISEILLTALGPKGLQGEIIKENLSPLEKAINTNFKLLGLENEFFFQCQSSKKKEIFQFGWINSEKEKVNFNTLSDGEKAMFLIAFLVAIIEKKSPKIKILAVDKIEAIDESNLSNLFRGLKNMEDKLDNIIVCGRILDNRVLDIAKAEGFKITDLSEPFNRLNKNTTKLIAI